MARCEAPQQTASALLDTELQQDSFSFLPPFSSICSGYILRGEKCTSATSGGTASVPKGREPWTWF